MTDTIADMFTRIRNAHQVNHEDVMIPFSKEKLAIAKILREEGFVRNFEITNTELKKRFIRISLKYTPEGQPAITSIKRISRPGCRRYVRKREIPKHYAGFGINIVSTSKGLMSGRKARLSNVGGELVGEVF